MIGILLLNLFVHQIVFANENREPTVAETFEQQKEENKQQVQNKESVGPTNTKSSASDQKESKNKGTETIETETNEAESNNEVSVVEESPSFFSLLLQLFFYTGIVIVMIYGLIKFLAIRQRKYQHNQVFLNLGGTPLGANKSLQLVKIGGRMYLLGVAEQITLIKEITEEEEVSIIEGNLKEQESVISKNFVEILQTKLLKKDQDIEGSSFHQVFNQSLKNHLVKRKKLEDQLEMKGQNDKEGRFM